MKSHVMAVKVATFTEIEYIPNEVNPGCNSLQWKNSGCSVTTTMSLGKPSHEAIIFIGTSETSLYATLIYYCTCRVRLQETAWWFPWRWWDRLIYIMGIILLVRRHLYIETACWLSSTAITRNRVDVISCRQAFFLSVIVFNLSLSTGHYSK